jgi:hypothetical protein
MRAHNLAILTLAGAMFTTIPLLDLYQILVTPLRQLGT